MSQADRSIPSAPDTLSIKPGWGASIIDGGPEPPPARGIDPRLWGPSAWTFMHYVALGYPVNPTPADADDARAFLSSLQFILPCQKCRLNLASHLNTMPPDKALAQGRDAFFDWMVDLHNVSISEHCRPCVTREMAKRLYTQNRIVPVTLGRRRSEIACAFVTGACICLLMLWATRKTSSR